MYFRKRMGLDGLKLGANVEIGQNKVQFTAKLQSSRHSATGIRTGIQINGIEWRIHK